MAMAPRGNRPSGGARPKKFRTPRRKVCIFSVEHAENVDYKQMIVAKYRNKLIADNGKIVPRRTTGTSARYQRMVTQAVKRARHMALLPFVVD